MAVGLVVAKLFLGLLRHVQSKRSRKRIYPPVMHRPGAAPLRFLRCRVPHTPPLRVGVLNLPQGVALVTTRSGQTPPASKFVLAFPGFHRHHGNSFGLGTFSSALALVDVKNWSRRRNLRRKAAEMGLR